MSGTSRIVYSKLLGFDALAAELADGVDFQDNAVSAKLGAKTGGVEMLPPSGRVDFQSDMISAKLGAKIGGENV